MKVDTDPKGLLVPAWSDSRHRLSARVVFASGRFAGMTLAEVARETGLKPDRVRWAAMNGQCPSTLRPGMRRGEALRQCK